jgi:hypothetical protein
MPMKRVTLLAIAALILCGSLNKPAYTKTERIFKQTVSALDLLINPKIYNNQMVCVQGYYVDDTKRLYPSRDFADGGMYCSGISVIVNETPKVGYIAVADSKRVKNPTLCDCSKHYVVMWGKAELSPPKSSFDSGSYKLSNIQVVLIH